MLVGHLPVHDKALILRLLHRLSSIGHIEALMDSVDLAWKGVSPVTVPANEVRISFRGPTTLQSIVGN